MPSNTDQWQDRVKQALLRDPKKTSVMSVLLLVLIKVIVHALPSGGAAHPPSASGMIIAPAVIPSTSSPARVGLTQVLSESQLQDWLGAKVPPLDRNDFLVNADAFPIDPTRSVTTVSDGSFWSRLKKSLALQADQRDKRQNQINAIKALAESIRPQSTMMGVHPRAMVNGKLLAEGDTVSGFRLVQVQPREIVVEQAGVRFEVPMK